MPSKILEQEIRVTDLWATVNCTLINLKTSFPSLTPSPFLSFPPSLLPLLSSLLLPLFLIVFLMLSVLLVSGIVCYLNVRNSPLEWGLNN